jgi:hypothetical protein
LNIIVAGGREAERLVLLLATEVAPSPQKNKKRDKINKKRKN